jgi:hypothetical protein
MELQPTDRNVFILGAGFSADAGAPLLKDFLDRSRQFMDDPSSGLEEDERGYFNDVFEFRREMAQAREKVSIDLDNIEELFGLVEVSRRLGIDKQKTRDATVYMIAKTLELAVQPAGPSRRPIRFDVKADFSKEFRAANNHGLFRQLPGYGVEMLTADIYQYFAALACGMFDDPKRQMARANTFITFNYDLILDHALQRLQIQPDYQLDLSLLQTFDLPAAGRKCSLLKLHGSANWGVCGECRERVLVLQDKVGDSPREFRSRICEKCHKQLFQPLLIPPSWDKSEYHSIMTPVWAKAVAELKAATRICIIGYSMPPSDLFFKYLLTMALSENHGLYKLLVVDLKSPVSRLEERYDQLLERLFRERRFKFEDDGFQMFFGSGSRALSALGRGEMLGGNIGF